MLPPRRIALQTATSLQSMSAAGEPRRHVARSETAAAAACEGAAKRERRASGGLAPRASALPGTEGDAFVGAAGEATAAQCPLK